MLPDTKTTAETVRDAAQAVAQTLLEGLVGGSCYRGAPHACFMQQGRRPLALYKSEELCERCALSWHAVMP